MINIESITGLAMSSSEEGGKLFLTFKRKDDCHEAYKQIKKSKQSKGIMRWLKQKDLQLEVTEYPKIDPSDKAVPMYRMTIIYTPEAVKYARRAYRHISDRM